MSETAPRPPQDLHDAVMLCLLGVLLVVGSCAALVASRLESFGPHPIDDTRIAMHSVEQGLVLYAARNKGQHPERLEDAAKYYTYETVPTDAWGRPFLYLRQPAETGLHEYVLVSLGEDGLPGGEGVAADLVIWSNGPRR